MKWLLLLLFALALSPAALADGGPSPGVTVGGAGVSGSEVRYVTVGNGSATALEAIGLSGGTVRGWLDVKGSWGIPTVTYDGTTGGLSRDGTTLVLAATSPYTCTAHRCSLTGSTFAVYSAKSLRLRERVQLKGIFSFDALSPDGNRLYLIQYLASPGLSKYVVRAYDLGRERLLPGTIADRTQRGWKMQGQPMTRVASVGGRFVYTLYANQGGYPFVHALDTVRGVAHCVGLPWHGSQAGFAGMRLSLRGDGRTLEVSDPSGADAPAFAIDVRTYSVSQLGSGSPRGLPWWPLVLFALLALVAGGFVRRNASWFGRAPAAANG
ncbi:MAG TPA: hypothetical protein VGM80_03900 [Gaiellaceae bacterium]|jgi:hypothetical protein